MQGNGLVAQEVHGALKDDGTLGDGQLDIGTGREGRIMDHVCQQEVHNTTTWEDFLLFIEGLHK